MHLLTARLCAFLRRFVAIPNQDLMATKNAN
jgi:hypothetical protein